MKGTDFDRAGGGDRPKAVYWKAEAPRADMFDHVRVLVGEGLACFPLRPGAKVPLIPRERGGRGCDDATLDLGRLLSWWRRCPSANIGIGVRASGLLVVDIDPQHEGDITMEGLVAKYGKLPPTLTARTGSGGWHYLYRAPAVPFRYGANVLGPGVDIPASYIVSAPSRHPNGRPYVWLSWGTPIAPCPAWVSALAAPRPEPPPRPSSPRSASQASAVERARAWLAKMPPSVQGQKTLAHKDAGNGSDTMFWAAVCCVRGFDLDADTALDLLREYNRRAEPRWSDAELRHKIKCAGRSSKPAGFLLNVPRTGRAA